MARIVELADRLLLVVQQPLPDLLEAVRLLADVDELQDLNRPPAEQAGSSLRPQVCPVRSRAFVLRPVAVVVEHLAVGEDAGLAAQGRTSVPMVTRYGLPS